MYRFKGDPADRELLRRSVRALRRPGSGEPPLFVDGGVGLAWAGPAAQDPAGGGQPVTNEDGTLHIACDARIFNAPELRRHLESKGHRFATPSEAEVILHLYEEQGDRCTENLNGQWAFALWDGRRKRLLLARDPFGIRPLVYTEAAGALLFGSAVQSLFVYPETPRRLDLRALSQLLALSVTLPPRTLFERVHELAPGQSLVVERGRANAARHGPAAAESRSTEAAGPEEFLDLLADAVRIRVRQPGPPGVWWDGGLGSALAAALARPFTNGTFRAFSAEVRATRAGLRPRPPLPGLCCEEVRFTDEQIRQAFPAVVRRAEKPLLGMAPLYRYLLADRAREQGFAAMLAGEGAAELFGGPSVREAKTGTGWGPPPDSNPGLLPFFPPRASVPRMETAGRQSAEVAAFPRRAAASPPALLSLPARAELRSYDAAGDLQARLPDYFHAWTRREQAQYLAAAYLLPGYTLPAAGNWMSTAHGVETRYPFLDPRLARWSARWRPGRNGGGAPGAHLLRRAAEKLLPLDLLRPGVRTMPGRGLPALARAPYAAELLDPARVRRDGIFDPEEVRRLAGKFRSGNSLSKSDCVALLIVLSTALLAEEFL